MTHGRIVVAGAGHGGLAAAILLARRGFDVTLAEAQAEDALGYDWRDCIDPRCFADAGLEPPPQTPEPMCAISYFGPRKNVCIRPPQGYYNGSCMIERKELLRHLVALARASGVHLCFSCRVTGAHMHGTRVAGVRTDAGILDGDCVIDAAGMDSPVRKGLPRTCGIEREIAPQDTLCTYRALYANTGAPTDLPVYSAYFYHNGHRGMDWVVRETETVDVLVSAIGSLSPQQAAEAVADFRHDHPYLGETVVRGGAFAKIPLRRTLPQFVCDGYAAIGDSAAMVEPLNGSGMSITLRSAALLAQTIMQAGACTTAELWPYVHAYFQKNMRHILRQEALKDAMLHMSESSLNAMFEKKILSRKDMYGGTADAADRLHKAAGLLSTPPLIPVFARCLVRIRRIDALWELLPAQYDAQRTAQWKRAYAHF